MVRILEPYSLHPVDFARGHFSALCWAGIAAAREVHVLRWRAAFERAGLLHLWNFARRALDLMREVQDLGNGYWFPTPLRRIAGERLSLVIGATPTRELSRHYPSVARRGFARVAEADEVADLPAQPLDAWLGLSIADSVAWARAELQSCRDAMGDTRIEGPVEYFEAAFGNARRRGRWTPSPPRAEAGDIVLCRRPLGNARFLPFMAQRDRNGRIVREAPAPNDVRRLQFGLAALCGEPVAVAVSGCDDGIALTVPMALPRPERQLLAALNTTLERSGTCLLLDDEFVPLILSRLKRLGCHVHA